MSARSPARPVVPALVALLLLASLLAVGACGPEATEPIERLAGLDNVLLVTLDTTRADRLGCYGHEAAATPRLDALAEQGVLFERCLTVAPVTLPSHASILTGLLPFRHGARNNGTHVLPEEVETLAERLADAGLASGAVVSAFVLDARYGLDQGFADYDDDLSRADVQAGSMLVPESDASDAATRALAWLAEHDDERFFLWLHFYDPHAPYAPPEPYRSAHADPYDAELAYTDAALGRVLDGLAGDGRLDRTLVVVTADHGESLGEHGESTHSVFIHDATTRVPLLFHHPSLSAGARLGGVVSVVDIVPTVLELLGEAPEPGVDGRSLAPFLRGTATAPPADDRLVYAESMTPLFSYGWSDLRAVSDAHGRFIRAPRPEFYDLRIDPGETDNVFAADPRRATRHAAALADWLADGEVLTSAGDVDEAARRTLAALGYVARDPDADGAERADPKDFAGLESEVHRGLDALRRGRPAEAEAILRGVLVAAPEHHEAQTALVNTWLGQARLEDARPLLARMVARPVPDVLDLITLADVDRRLGVEDWRGPLDLARDLHPRDPRPWTFEAAWVLAEGRAGEAVGLYQRATERDPDGLEAWRGLGRARRSAGDTPGAVLALQRAVALDGEDFESAYLLGVVLQAAGESARARDAFIGALRIDPEDVSTRVHLGALATSAGRLTEAERWVREAIERDAENRFAWHNLALALLAADRAVEAADAATRSTQLATAAGEMPLETWILQLDACRRAGRDAAVLEAATSILAARPGHVRALVEAAVAQGRLGQEPEARARLSQARLADPAWLARRVARDPELAALVERLGP